VENIWLEPVVDAWKTYFGSKSAKIVVDVGTRDGDDAEYLKQKMKAKRVIAVDANPIAVQKTKDAYPLFTVYETAVSDYVGETSFVQIVSDNKDLAGCSSMNYEKIESEEVFRSSDHHIIKVPVTRLDKLLGGVEQYKKNPIDVIKIDIEGYTYQALVGLGDIIWHTKIFHLETETQNLFSGHKNNLDVASYMQSKGFVLVNVSYEWGFGIQDQVWINPLYIVEEE
jgi:FkbM family methyltransferase